MRSTLVQDLFPELQPGQLYMHFVRQKNRYWPVRLLQISERHPKTKKPLKAKLQVFNNPKSPKKFNRAEIILQLKNSSPPQLIPFVSVYNNDSNMPNSIESKNRSPNDTSEFQMVMRRAKQAFDDQLATPAMYQKLKKLSLQNQDVKIQSLSSLSQFKSKDAPISYTTKLNNNSEFKNMPKMTECFSNQQKQGQNDIKRYSKKFCQVNQKENQIQGFEQRQYKRQTENKFEKKSNLKQAENFSSKLINRGPKVVIYHSSDDSNSSQSSKSERYPNDTNSMKRGHTQILNNDGSIKSLESPKKKRRSSKNNAAITNLENIKTSMNPKLSKIQSSASQVAKKTQKQTSNKIQQKSQRINQQYLSLLLKNSSKASNLSKSNKLSTNKKKNPNLQVKKPKGKRADSKVKYQSLFSNKIHNQKINFDDEDDLKSVKSQAIWNIAQLTTKKVIQNSKKMNQLESHTKMVPNSHVKVEMEKSLSSESCVSSRTRSKALLNKKINLQLTNKKLKPNPRPLIKRQLSTPKRGNTTKKQNNTHHPKKEQNNANLIAQKFHKKLPLLKPSENLHRQTEIYTSQYGQKLNVENLFFIFKKIFGNSILKDDSARKLKRCSRKIGNKDFDKDYNSKSRIYACIMNEEKAKQIENQLHQLKQKRNHHQTSRIENEQKVEGQQEESEQQIFLIKNEEQTNDNQFPFNLPKTSKFVPNDPFKPSIKIEKILEEKDQKPSQFLFRSNQSAKVKNQETSISFDEQMKTDTTNSEPSSKNQVSSERLSIKYRMNLIESFDDLLNLIKKEVHGQQEKVQINQMDLEVNGTENQFKPMKDKATIFLVIEKDLVLNLQMSEMPVISKRKIIKKKKGRKQKKLSKIHADSESQLKKINQNLNNSVQEIVFTWPVQKFIFHGLFTHLQNLYFSINLNQQFIQDLFQYKGSQNEFFAGLFSIIDSISISSMQRKMQKTSISHPNSLRDIKKLSKNSHSISKSSNNSLSLRSRSQINSKPKDCNHSICNKITPSDQKILQNLRSILSIEISFSDLDDKAYQIYRDFIVKQAQLIFNQFEIHFKHKKTKGSSLTLDRNTFKQNCFNIVSKAIESKKQLKTQSCFYREVLTLMVKVFHLFSYETFSNGIEKEQQKHQMIKHEKTNSTGSSFQNPKQLVETKLNTKDSKIRLDKVVKHPNQKRFTQVTTSPFSIHMDDENERSSEITSTQTLNSSEVTEFERNTSDFTSFLTNIIPNVDIDKHKRNFRKNQEPNFASYQDQANNSQVSSFRQYSQKLNQKPESIHHNKCGKGNHILSPSAISVMVNNSASSKGNDTKKKSIFVSNQIQTNSKTDVLMKLQQNDIGQRSIQMSEKMSQMMEISEMERMEMLKEEIIQMFDRIETENLNSIHLQN